MPSNIFATTGANVSILFLDKNNKKGDIVLMDASKMGSNVKDGENQKTVLSPDEENLIISTFNNHLKEDDFAVIVSYKDLKEKHYSLSAGQYFDVKIDYSDITPEQFNSKINEHKTNLDGLFYKSKQLEMAVTNALESLTCE